MHQNRYTWVNGRYREVIDGVLQVDVPKHDGVAHWWHPNGQLAREETRVDGQPHGLAREWYENGQIKRETPYNHGFIHGTVKQWNTEGKLLGTFTLRMGHGISREWYDDGTLKCEIEILGEGRHKGRVWDEAGGSHEVFLWDSHPVSKEVFEERMAKENVVCT